MAVTPTFPSRDALQRRFRFRPLDAMVGAGVFVLLYVIVRVGASAHVPIRSGQATLDTSPSQLPYYAVRSVLRMFIALFFAYAFSLGYAYAAARSRRARRVLIPALDILQSVPVLGFLAVTVTFFLALFPGSELGLEAAAIFAVFTSQAWNITFGWLPTGTASPPAAKNGLSSWPARHRCTSVTRCCSSANWPAGPTAPRCMSCPCDPFGWYFSAGPGRRQAAGCRRDDSTVDAARSRAGTSALRAAASLMVQRLPARDALPGPRSEVRQLLQAGHDVRVHGIWRLGAIHSEQPFPVRVVLQQRNGFVQVHPQPPLDDGLGVLRAPAPGRSRRASSVPSEAAGVSMAATDCELLVTFDPAAS